MDYQRLPPYRELCRVCDTLLVAIGTQNSPSPCMLPFKNIQEIIDSTTTGCHLCSLILVEISPKAQEEYLQELRLDPTMERQFVTIIWQYPFPNSYGADLKPILRLEEARPRAGVSNRQTVCDLRFESMLDYPVFGE